MSLIREMERYIFLPLRFFNQHLHDCKEQRQKCKVCGQADGFNFHVRDDIWEVVTGCWANRVVCLRCFDRLAKEKEINYVPFLGEIWFCGFQSLNLKIGDGHNVGSIKEE